MVDPRVGTVAVHRHHLIVCNSSSAEWPSKVEGMSPTITELARGAIRLPGRAMVTLSDFAPFKKNMCGCNSISTQAAEDHSSENKYKRIDVAIFPLGLVARQLDSDGVNRLLDWLSHDVLPTSWSPMHTQLPHPPFDHSWLELTNNRHIFVCTHGSRDRLCGVHGGKLLDDLRALIDQHGLGKHVAAWSTSHIGGHKYAANAIIYPRGDWYGTWCDRCRCSTELDSSAPSAGKVDAQAIIDAATRDVVWWDAWRGAINLSKKDQIATWRNHNAGHGDSTGSQAEQQSVGSDTFTSWTPKTSRRSSIVGS
ncbi:hypothetical protein IW140_005804 [Coemansia sp. RSA 1813]|nr:hypothetical protein EV178_005843 [Coemansia sp. RSA 1646]KAJ1767845.1 hypothetical protein LPJ74_005147 [Coemansia sp. RSA 1843]KAJ2092115.1 hypothetical protein IW138_001481 [Coemansia sp. RSA 986]KAJ2564278.1 hypothetical protein IW140_005804 [Coemansia sp. RSA 1813]